MNGPRPGESASPMNSPSSPIQAAVTRARIERVIARLPGLSDEHLEDIEATLFEFGELRHTCHRCGERFRPYLERCPGCRRESRAPARECDR